MRCLVTGGTGFVGSNLVTYLLNENHEVIIVGNVSETRPKGFQGKYLQPTLIGIDWDEITNIDILFHLAANNDTTDIDEREMFRANLESSKVLFEHVVKNGCKHIIYASSTAVYGNVKTPYREDGPVQPLNPYARSKLLLDKYAMKFAQENPNVTIIGLRYCNIYGPGEAKKGKRASMVYQLAQQMINKNPRIFKWGEQKRDYIYIKDVVRANMLAIKTQESCIVNCGFGKATSFNRLVEILNKILGLKRSPEYFDNPYAGSYQEHTLCDMTLAKQKLGFTPKYDLEQGIQEYYDSGFLINNK